MRILATGTTGTIGRYFGDNVEPIKVDLNSRFWNTNCIRFAKDDSMIHLAGVVGEKKVREDEKYAYAVNVIGSVNIAKRFKDCSEGKFIYISSSHVYAKKNEGIKEDDLVDPKSLYSKQKLEVEDKLKELFNNRPNQLLIIRVFSVLDWNLGESTLSGAISRMLNSNGESKITNADDIRDFLTPKTISSAILKLVKSNSDVQLVNLCSGIGTSIKEAAIRMLTQKKCIVNPLAMVPGNSNNPIIVGNPTLIESITKQKLEWLPGV